MSALPSEDEVNRKAAVDYATECKALRQKLKEKDAYITKLEAVLEHYADAAFARAIAKDKEERE